MGLFTKYRENQGKPVSGSVVSKLPSNRKNTLFDGAVVNGESLPEKQIIQTPPKQDVNLGRAESSLFKKRQEIDEQRIKNFLKTPGGTSHKAKEIRLARVNPVFRPGFDGQNPTRLILPDKVASNSRLSGGGIFDDKFGLFGITNDGYIKYINNPDKSKLAFLTRKYNLGVTPDIESSATNNAFIRGLTNFSIGLRNISNQILGAFGFRNPSTKEELYSYVGGPGSDNGVGLTTLYKYDPIQFNTSNNNFSTQKSNFVLPRDIRGRNIKRNNFWNLVSSAGSNTLPSFLEFPKSQFSPQYTSTNFNFQFGTIGTGLLSGNITIDIPRRFVFSSDISPVFNLYFLGISKPSVSGYYNSKPITLWNQEDRSKALDLSKPEGTKTLSNYSSTNTDKLNNYYESGSLPAPPETEVGTDLIPFRIEIIDLDTPDNSFYLYFKAFIDSFDDTFGVTHDIVVSPGNPAGKIFKYNTFQRDIRLNFKVAAFSKIELSNIYKKLNRLAATTLPFGTSDNENQIDGIRTVISKLTVGNWCNRLPGVITSVNFVNIMESPWDIDEGLPMMINVNLGFSYSSAYEDNTLRRPTVRSFIGPNRLSNDPTNNTILFGDNMFQS
jgi:hypothetical protein